MLCDLHTHILHGIDDGAADLACALELVKQEQDCGVDTIVLTPHFRAQKRHPEEFFALRARATEELRAACGDGVTFRLGAEVLYSQYLSSIENIRDFCIEGTDYLLLEMPYFAEFNDRVLQAVGRLRDEHGILPILAHVERYEAVRRNPYLLASFREYGCLFQVNASTFETGGFFARRFVKTLVRERLVDLVASDCHDSKSRPAALKGAFDSVTQRFGADFAEYLKHNAVRVLENKRV